MAKAIKSFSIDPDIAEWIDKQGRSLNASAEINRYLRRLKGEATTVAELKELHKDKLETKRDIEEELRRIEHELNRVAEGMLNDQDRFMKDLPMRMIKERLNYEDARTEYQRKFGELSEEEWNEKLSKAGLR